MKWRDMLVGAIATLVVTILSGIAVFYLTRTPQEKPLEKLRYSIDRSASFETENNRVALVNVVLINQGDANADNIVGSIEFSVGVIKDKKVVASSGDVSGFSLTSKTANSINFNMPHLLPKERISISFLLESATSPKPIVSLKSDKTIGAEVSLFASEEKDEITVAKKVLSALFPLLIGLFMTLLLLIFVKQRLMSRLSRGSSLNNNGFVFMHKGLNEVASTILSEAVSKGEDSAHAIANYATSIAINGEIEKARQYISDSEFIARSSHEKAVAAFNHGIISFLDDNKKEGIAQFEQALKLSRKEILFYIKNSNILAELIKKYPEIEPLLSN